MDRRSGYPQPGPMDNSGYPPMGGSGYPPQIPGQGSGYPPAPQQPGVGYPAFPPATSGAYQPGYAPYPMGGSAPATAMPMPGGGGAGSGYPQAPGMGSGYPPASGSNSGFISMPDPNAGYPQMPQTGVTSGGYPQSIPQISRESMYPQMPELGRDSGYAAANTGSRQDRARSSPIPHVVSGSPHAQWQSSGYPPSSQQSSGFPPSQQSSGFPPTSQQSSGFAPTPQHGSQNSGYPQRSQLDPHSSGYPPRSEGRSGHSPVSWQGSGYVPRPDGSSSATLPPPVSSGYPPGPSVTAGQTAVPFIPPRPQEAPSAPAPPSIPHRPTPQEELSGPPPPSVPHRPTPQEELSSPPPPSVPHRPTPQEELSSPPPPSVQRRPTPQEELSGPPPPSVPRRPQEAGVNPPANPALAPQLDPTAGGRPLTPDSFSCLPQRDAPPSVPQIPPRQSHPPDQEVPASRVVSVEASLKATSGQWERDNSGVRDLHSQSFSHDRSADITEDKEFLNTESRQQGSNIDDSIACNMKELDFGMGNLKKTATTATATESLPSEDPLYPVLSTSHTTTDDVTLSEESSDGMEEEGLVGHQQSIDELPFDHPANILSPDELVSYDDLGSTVLAAMAEKKRKSLDSYLDNCTVAAHIKPVADLAQLPRELRLVLVGKTGVGKSATANTLLGEEIFASHCSSTSVTQTNQVREVVKDGIQVRVLDTPGLFDTDRDLETVCAEITRAVDTFCDGVHAFLYVLNAASHRFTEEDQRTVKEIKYLFKDEMLKRTIVIFTHADTVFTTMTMDEYINKQPKRSPLYQFIAKETNKRVIGLNNAPQCRYLQERQRDLLFRMIYRMQEEQSNKPYLNELFLDAQEIRTQRQGRMLEQKEKAKTEAVEREAARQKAMVLYSKTVEESCKRILKGSKKYEDEDELILDVKADVHQDPEAIDAILEPLKGVPPLTLNYMLENTCLIKVRSTWALYKIRKIRMDELEELIKGLIRQMQLEARTDPNKRPEDEEVMKRVLDQMPEDQKKDMSMDAMRAAVHDIVDKVWQEQQEDRIRDGDAAGEIRTAPSDVHLDKQLDDVAEDLWGDDFDEFDDDFYLDRQGGGEQPPPLPAAGPAGGKQRANYDGSEMSWLFTGKDGSGAPPYPLLPVGITQPVGAGDPAASGGSAGGGGLPYPSMPGGGFPVAGQVPSGAPVMIKPQAIPKRKHNVSDYYDWFYEKLDKKAEQWMAHGTLTAKDAKELERALKNNTKMPAKIRLLAKSVVKELPDEGQAYFQANEDEVDIAVKNYIIGRYGDLDNLSKKVRKKVKCFPGSAVVLVRGMGACPMSELSVGDHVLTASANGNTCFEEVFAFSHADVTARAAFLKLTTGNGTSILVSEEHLVHAGEIGVLRPASSVRVGDELFCLEGYKEKPTIGQVDIQDCSMSHTLASAKVVSIEEEVCTGVYCPHTPGGSLVVDGVLASCYTTVIPVWLSQALLTPPWWLYRLLPGSWFRWLFPYDPDEGVPRLMQRLEQLVS